MLRSRVTCLVATTVVAIAVNACNARLPVIDSTSPTAPSSVVGTPPVPVSTLVSLIVDPSAVFGGNSATGRVLLSFPAPASGMSVALSTSDSAVTVPASISLPAGTDAANFTVATRGPSSEVDVTITASAAGRAVQAPLSLWLKMPPFVATWTDSGSGQRTNVNRVTRNGQWRANCYRSTVSFGASTPTVVYAFLIGAPEGSPLTPGTYENADTLFTNPRSPNRPLLDILAPGGSSCPNPAISRFTVTEADLVADQLGTVRRFGVTFEQQCGATTTRGEALLIGVAPTNTSGDRCIVR